MRNTLAAIVLATSCCLHGADSRPDADSRDRNVLLGNSDTPDNPDTPDTPGNPDTPDTPDNPGTTGTSDLVEIGAAIRDLEANEKPPPRSISVDELQAWYGAAIDFKRDANLAHKVQEAESLVTGIFFATDVAKIGKWKSALFELGLPPMVLRAVVRQGHVPLSPQTRVGSIAVPSTPLLGFSGDRASGTVHVPANYTPDHAWPVILALSSDLGTLGPVPGYIVVEPVPHGGAPYRGYCWGPAMVARAVPWSVLDWTMLHYRVDPDRIFLHGQGCYGGVGARNLGTVYTDRIAAICPNGGPTLHQEYANVYRNLHDVPLLMSDGPSTHTWESETLAKFGIPAEHERKNEFDFFAQHVRQRAPEKLRFSSHEDVPAALRHYFVEIVEANPEGNTEIIYNVKSFMNYYPRDKDWQNDPALAKRLTDTSGGRYQEQLQDTVKALSDDTLYHSENGGPMSKADRELLIALFSEKNIDRYRALLKQATAAHLILETRPAWMKSRDIDLHLDRRGNAIVIDRTAYVKKIRIYLDDDVVDMDKEIWVKAGDRILTKVNLERSSQYLIQEMIKTHRRDITYWGEIVVPVK